MFLSGDYTALETAGQQAEHIVAFAAGGTLVAVPRLIGGLLAERDGFPLGEPVWGTTQLTLPRRSRGRYHDVFTGRTHEAGPGNTPALRASELFADFPVAVLVPEEPR